MLPILQMPLGNDTLNVTNNKYCEIKHYMFLINDLYEFGGRLELKLKSCKSSSTTYIMELEQGRIHGNGLSFFFQLRSAIKNSWTWTSTPSCSL